MKIDAVDFFYVAMPEVTIAADGSQDALVVRVSAGGHIGWGECEASPLPSIAAFVTPMSHGACRPVSASVLGATLDGPEDIKRMAATIAYNSMDLLQAAHTWSGIEMALWDVLGKARVYITPDQSVPLEIRTDLMEVDNGGNAFKKLTEEAP